MKGTDEDYNYLVVYVHAAIFISAMERSPSSLSYDSDFAAAAAPLIELIKEKPRLAVGDVEER